MYSGPGSICAARQLDGSIIFVHILPIKFVVLDMPFAVRFADRFQSVPVATQLLQAEEDGCPNSIVAVAVLLAPPTWLP